MDRHVEKIDDSHDRMVLVMAGSKEAERWRRTFPDPMPGTHTLSYRWVQNEREQVALVIKPAPAGKGARRPAAAKRAESPETEVESEYGTDEEIAEIIDQLRPLSDGDIATKAAELGMVLPRNISQAQTRAEVARKIYEKAQAKKRA